MRRLNRGFTLTEVMVASAITVGMGMTLTVLARSSQRTWLMRQDQMTVSFELRRGVQNVVRELSRTAGDPAQANGNQLQHADGTEWLATDLQPYNSVRFRVPQDLDGNGTVLNATTGQLEWSTNTFTLELGGNNGRELQRVERDAGGALVTVPNNPNPRTLAYGVTALQFQRIGASELEIRITVQRNAEDTQSAMLATRVRLRN